MMAGGFYPPICKSARRFGGRAGGWLIHCMHFYDIHETCFQLNFCKCNILAINFGSACAWAYMGRVEESTESLNTSRNA